MLFHGGKYTAHPPRPSASSVSRSTINRRILTPKDHAHPYTGRLIVITLRPGLISSFFSIRSMRWLGKYSYGIYVLHVILFAYLEEPIRSLIELHLTPNKGAVVLLAGLLIFLLSLTAAYLSFNLYEKRFLRLKRFFDYRRAASTPPFIEPA